MYQRSINPATEELIAEYPTHSANEIESIVSGAATAQAFWKSASFSQRSAHMSRAADILRKNEEEFAQLMVREMGKPVRQARAEVSKCAWVCDYYAEHAADFLRPSLIETDASESFVTYQPLGIVLAIMPWNFPFWQVFRFAAPTLMAGNGALLKHASNVPGCALAIEKIFREAEFPENLFRTLLISSEDVPNVIEHALVRAISLTGSTEAGRSVAGRAGASLKKTVLELGGSDPYVVLDDADLNEAAATCVDSRLINSGQSCIAAKRFIVLNSVREKFETLFIERMNEKKMGDPSLEDTDVGPQARVDLRDDLHRQVTESIRSGARCLLGGYIPDGAGAYYPPTVLTDVARGMPAYEEELFGPVAAIIPVADEEEAIAVANDSVFGLGAAVMTSNTERGKKIASRRLEAGSCFVNAFVKSDPRLPFGGIKESGYGRELGRNGILEFVNIKTVYVK